MAVALPPLTLQTCRPAVGRGDRVEGELQGSQPIWRSGQGAICHLGAGGVLDGRSLGQVLSLAVWDLETQPLRLHVAGCTAGEVLLQVFHETPCGARRLLRDVVLHPEQDSGHLSADVSVPYAAGDLGFLFHRVHAMGADLELRRCAWVVHPDAPLPSVRLAVVVTHHQRESSVMALAQGLATSELQPELAAGHVALLVVDNSTSLDPAQLPSFCRVVANPNYGGSGGFSRGLMVAEAQGFSHCLFMDDDVSVEPEAILRTLAYQRLHPQRAVAGVLLQAECPWLVLEMGGLFDRFCHPLGFGTDVADLANVLPLFDPSRSGHRPNYGAWCYFSFAVQQVKHWPFPFFVRGDDILFSLMNGFPLFCLPGVSAHVPSFLRKEGPLQALLDTRMHLIIRAVIERLDRWQMVVSYAKPYLNFLLTYRYGHCLAMHEGFGDYRHCSSRFSADLEATHVRAVAKALADRFWLPPTASERLSSAAIPPADHRLLVLARRILAACTLNLHLLPGAGWLKRRQLVWPLTSRPPYGACLDAHTILFADVQAASRQDDQSRLCRFDQRQGLRCLLHLLEDCLMLALRHRALSQQAQRTVDHHTRRAFWDGVYPNAHHWDG